MVVTEQYWKYTSLCETAALFLIFSAPDLWALQIYTVSSSERLLKLKPPLMMIDIFIVGVMIAWRELPGFRCPEDANNTAEILPRSSFALAL